MQSNLVLKAFLSAIEEAADPASLAWDIRSLEQMSAADRSVAEDALIERMLQGGDLRAIKSLALLQSRRALPALERVRRDGSPLAVQAAVRALALITGEPELVEETIRQTRGMVDAFTAWDLKSMDGEAATRGLLATLHSDDLAARMHALDGLCDRACVVPLRHPNQAPLGRYELLLGAKLRALYQPAARTLQKVFAQLAAGVQPEALDLVYRPSENRHLADQFWRSCGRTGRPYRTALLADMSPHDAEWAYALIVARVEDHDLRSLDAIEALKLRWSDKALTECLRDDATVDEAFRARAERTLRVLST